MTDVQVPAPPELKLAEPSPPETEQPPPPQAAPPPARDPGPTPAPQQGMRKPVLLGVAVVVALLVSFTVYEYWFTDMVQGRSQAKLLSDFKSSLLLDTTDELLTPPPGQPLGIIQSERMGMEQVMVQGIDASDTQLGPGHDPASPAPGQAGNAVVIGRSATYGAPFANLSSLEKGDQLQVVTRQGEFTYEVTTSSVAPLGDAAPVAPTTTDQLTLITANGKFRPNTETVVVAKLMGAGIQAPGALPLPPPGQEPGKSPGGSPWPPVLLWGQLLLLAAGGTYYLYRRRWSTSVTYLLSTPILIALTLLFFRAVDNLLPPAL